MKLSNLFKEQEKLDKEIQEKHFVTYESTLTKRFLAFYVELGELANATRCFKFWSYKQSESKERILDEFADGLHFILSLGIALNFACEDLELEIEKNDINEQFLLVYSKTSKFLETHEKKDYYSLFNSFINIAFALGFEENDIFDAYYSKLDVNYKRQEENY